MLTLLFFVVATIKITYNAVDQAEDNNKNACQYVESIIRSKEQNVEEKFNTIYNNDKLRNDLVNFLTYDTEGYLEDKLSTYNMFEYNATIDNFILQSLYDDKHIKQISIYNYGRSTLTVYNRDTTVNLKTYTDVKSPDKLVNEANGYMITREFTNPNTLSKLCSISYMYDNQSMFSNVWQFNTGQLVLATKGGSFFKINKNQFIKGLDEHLKEIVKTGNPTGKFGTGILNKVYYTVYYPAQGEYKLISFVDTEHVRRSLLPTILLLLLCAMALFCFSEAIIVARIKRDARSFDSIIQIIESAKEGIFITSDVFHRKDEFGIIAKELNDMSTKLDNYIKNEYLLKLEQKRTQFELLQSRINPHFLYNTLEIIRSKALINNDVHVADAIENLGGIYRSIMKSESVIAFNTELELIEKYLKLMAFRYDGIFYYTIDVEESILGLKTLKFWMQPLVENFFVHGIDRKSDMNALIIKGRIEQQYIVIEIMDNGIGIDEDKISQLNERLKSANKSEGIGLFNVCSRLKMFYGEDNVDMEIVKNEEAGITIFVKISLEKSLNI